MFSIIANAKTQVQVEITSQTPTPQFMAAIANNYGGTAEDYTFYTMTEEEADRISNSDSYLLVWEGEKLIGLDFKPEDDKKWVRSEISLTSSKVTLNNIDVQKVRVFVKGEVYSQNEIIFNQDSIWRCQEAAATKDPGLNTSWIKEAPAVLLTLTILLSDKVTIDTSANFISKFPVYMPNDQEADMEVEFVNGVCKKVVVLNSIGNCGEWAFPSNPTRVDINGESYKVDKVAKFSGILPF